MFFVDFSIFAHSLGCYTLISSGNWKLAPTYITHLQKTCTKFPAKSFKFGVILLSRLYTSDRANPVFAFWLPTSDAQCCFSKAFTFQTQLLLLSCYVMDGRVYIWLSCVSELFVCFFFKFFLKVFEARISVSNRFIYAICHHEVAAFCS
jgi:hypothetical protein